MFVECELKLLFVSTFNTLVDGSARLHFLALVLLFVFCPFLFLGFLVQGSFGPLRSEACDKRVTSPLGGDGNEEEREGETAGLLILLIRHRAPRHAMEWS